MDLVELVIICMILFELIWNMGYNTIILHYKSADLVLHPIPEVYVGLFSYSFFFYYFVLFGWFLN